MVKIDRLSEQQDTLIANDIKDASDMPSVALAKTKALEEQAAKLEKEQMEKLKAQGKEKSATYRQYFGNRMLFKMILEKYREYGLIN